MKPNFALSLSFDGIRLLHRASGGWHFVGEVAVSDPDLSGALANLLKDGKARQSGVFRSKLIVPDAQIKYLTIDTPDMDTDARRIAAAEALNGATPYAVDALSFDVSPDGARTHVAAVARETLLEAETFATEHGFDPVSFVAAAENSDFLGEPFFGPTAHSKTILPDGTEVVPDGVRVVVVEPLGSEAEATNTVAPDIEVVEEADAPDAAPDAAPTTDAVELSGDPAPEADTKAEAEADASPALGSEPDSEPASGSDAEPDSDAAPDFAEAAKPTPPSQDGVDTAPDSDDAVKPDVSSDTSAPTPKPEAAPDTTDAAPKPEAAPETSDAPAIAAAKPSDAQDTALTTDDTPDAPEPEGTTPPLLGFATRRRQDPSSTPAPTRLGGTSRGVPDAAPKPQGSAQTAPARKEPPPISLTKPPKSVAESLRPTPALPLPPAPVDPAPDAAQEAPTAVVAAAEKPPRAGGFLSRRKPAADAAPAQSARAAKNAAKGDPEAARMTIFGARDGNAVGGKPRYLGLLLMAILLVFLAGVAAWATVFMDDGLARLFQGRERTLASTLPDDARDTLAQDVGATTQIETDREDDQDGVVVAALNDHLSDHGLSAEDAAVLDALRDPQPDPIAPEELDAAALEARYAVTGIWPIAPDLPSPADLIDIEDLYVTGIDPVSPALDAVALPALALLQTDGQLGPVASPAAVGSDVAQGRDGRVLPTPQGTLSPDGFTVFLGQPPAVPPATQARLDVVPDGGPEESALAQVRPQPRPDDLIEQNERATLGGLSRSELAGLRPRLRPKALQEIALEARQAEEAENAPDPVEPEDVQDAVVAALSTAPTLRPATRPRNFNRIVTRAQRNATTAAAATAPARTASVAPRSVTPAIPSTASVARNATVRNAINLRQVNLIGVYGTPSNRRALVRLSNGRYQKVEVGDRFDGGRVSAIGDSELRYQKGSRNLVLKMPQG